MAMRIARIQYPIGVANSSVLTAIMPVLTNRFIKNDPTVWAISFISLPHILKSQFLIFAMIPESPTFEKRITVPRVAQGAGPMFPYFSNYPSRSVS